MHVYLILPQKSSLLKLFGGEPDCGFSQPGRDELLKAAVWTIVARELSSNLNADDDHHLPKIRYSRTPQQLH
jgi:hypothetical protein